MWRWRRPGEALFCLNGGVGQGRDEIIWSRSGGEGFFNKEDSTRKDKIRGDCASENVLENHSS
jgi:hypothetical protein